MILQQYYEERGQLVAEARAILDALTDESTETEIQQAEERHDSVMAKVDALDKKIAREERQLAAENAEEERRSRQRPTGENLTVRGVDEPGSGEAGSEDRQAEYRDAFYAYFANGCDIGAVSNEQRQLLSVGYVENRTQTGGTDSEGGYTVPTTLANRIVEAMLDWGPMYDPGITDEMVTSSGNPFDMPTNDDTGNTGSALAEGADIVDDGSGDLVFGQVSFGAFTRATPWVKISRELLQDSIFDLERFIARKIGERLGRLANAELTTGVGGANAARGIVTAAAQGKAAAAATTIAGDEVIDLQHSVNAAYRRSPSCRFMFADTTLATLRKLKDGQGNYLWSMGDVRTDQPDVILGKPYSINDDVPPIATGNKSILFGDFSRYSVRKVGSPLVGTVRERFWPKVGLAGLIRFDGDLTDSGAIKALVQA
ncbi:MAG: phage major capsid protein [Pseudomonadota bacterium]